MRKEQINHILLQLLVVVAGVLLFSLLPGRADLRLFVNSDALYMPAIYLDLFVHHSGIKGWHLNTAPIFFPDMILHFPLMALLKSPSLTSLAFGLVQLFLMMFLINKLLFLADGSMSSNTRYLINLSFMLFPLSSLLGDSNMIPSQLLLSGYHGGFFINSLLAAILALSYLKTGKTGSLVFMGMVTLLAVISDKLFIMGFVAPATLFSLLHLFRYGEKLRFLVLILVLTLTTLLGMITLKQIDHSSAVEVLSAGWKMFRFESIPDALLHLVNHLKSVILLYPVQRWVVLATLMFLSGAPVYLIRYLRAYFHRKLKSSQEVSYGLILYLFLFVFLILLTPVINGTYMGGAHIRYNYAALVMGAVGFVYMTALLVPGDKIPRRFREYGTTVCTTLLLVVLMGVGLKNHAVVGLGNFVNHYPQTTKIMDGLKSEYGLTYGLGAYWQSKYSTLFSRNNLRLYSVRNKSFKPTYHASNENWYHDGGKGTYANPTFNFLEISAFEDTEKLKHLFGEQMDTLFSRHDLLVIKVPDFKIERKSREIYLLDP